MRIYFSGHVASGNVPERLIPELKPHIMLSFWEVTGHTWNKTQVRERVSVFLKRQRIKK